MTYLNTKPRNLYHYKRFTLLLGLALSMMGMTGCNLDTKDTHNTHHEEKHNEHLDKDGDEHHSEHEHHHTGGAKQIIPEGYQVNFTVSNHPLFLLSEVVTQGTPTTVKKLLLAGDVGHHGSLSPSDIKAIEDSPHVVWFGKNLESNLSKTLMNASNTVTLLDDPSLNILAHRNEKAEIISGTLDPHVWLDPENAKTIVNVLAKLHIKTNPQFTETYQTNAIKFASELDNLVNKHQANHTQHTQYWGSHDAFQYLEKSLNIKFAGALTTDHEIPAKASQIIWLNKNRPYETMCLLSQSEPKEGIKNKLKPITTQVLIEDMSNYQSYLQAWESIASKVETCVRPQT